MYPRLVRDSRIEIPCLVRGRPSYRWVQGWAVEYSATRKSTPERLDDARYLLRQTKAAAPEIKPFTCGDWHIWQGVAQILASDESAKKLHSFADVDECVNWLFLNGHKETARAFNAHAKG